MSNGGGGKFDHPHHHIVDRSMVVYESRESVSRTRRCASCGSWTLNIAIVETCVYPSNDHPGDGGDH